MLSDACAATPAIIHFSKHVFFDLIHNIANVTIIPFKIWIIPTCSFALYGDDPEQQVTEVIDT